MTIFRRDGKYAHLLGDIPHGSAPILRYPRTMARDPVLSFTDRGIFCPDGGFYIDPTRPVDRALITHGHSDHARSGHGHYLATEAAAPVIRHRLGRIDLATLPFGEQRRIGGVSVSFHPAGHIPGSAQIRVERAGEVWVVSGDYKVEPDGLCEPFAPVPCHSFITECTFGLPVFQWEPQAQVMEQINRWWAENRAAGRQSLLGAYSLGKAQRLLVGVDPGIGPILTHPAVEATNDVLRAQGIALPKTICLTPGIDPQAWPGALVIAPPAVFGTAWAARLGPVATGFASGWMALRAMRQRRGGDSGFVVSDHADWSGLNTAIRATGAERVFVTHGYTGPFQRWLASQGYDAGIVTGTGASSTPPGEAEA